MARYALVIGVAAYNNFRNLEKAVTDAEAIAQLLKRQGNFEEVKRLPAKWLKDESRWVVGADKKLTGKELGNALRTFLLEQAAKNEAVIYFAGHGFPASSCMGVEQGYLATSDCYEDGRNAIPLRDFNTLMVESDLSSLVVMLDCCYAGTLLERQLLEPAFTAFNTKRDYYLITACRGFQKAYEGLEHGVFTGAILKGLAAENADEKGQVSGDRLFDCIASELKGSGQEPIRMGWGRSLTLVQYQPKKTEIVVDETCPYQGLEAFGKEQARFFFGREKVVQLLMEKLGQANFVPIIGASGSGKSSVVRAGLIPQLEKNGWRVLEPILPGDEPLAELKKVLIELFGRTQGREVYSLIKTDGLRPVIERLSGSERLLLVVDQFEEVFTLCPKEEERRQFIELLTQVAELPDSRLAIVTTMRADFLEPCLSYELLTRLIQNESVYMPSLVGAELEEAIASPARLQGYELEQGLLGEIMEDVVKEPGCLPLLQFALTELWEKRDRQKHQLTVEKYQALEGVKGALNRHAQKIYIYKDFLKESPQQERSPQEQEWIKRIFLRLVRIGESSKDTRQRQPKAKLLAIGSHNLGAQDSERLHQQAISVLLDRLIQGRLLVTDQEDKQGEAWVNLAHEALMNGWQQFAQWRKENRQLRRLIDRMEDALREWQQQPKDENLMMGGLLAQVWEKWQEMEPDLDATAREFYQRSYAYEHEQSTTFRTFAESKLREQAAKVTDLLSLQPLDALVLAIQSIGLNLAAQSMGLNLKKLPKQILREVQDRLREAMETVTVSISFTGHEYWVTSVAFSPDSQMIVSGSTDNTVRLWNIQGDPIGQPFIGHEAYVTSVAFSPDGQVIVSSSCDRTVRLWDIQGNPIAQPFQGHQDGIISVAFSPNGQMIVSGSLDNTVRLWDLQGNLVAPPFQGHDYHVWSVAFSPDGQMIVSGSKDDTVRLWNIQGNLIGQPFRGHEGFVNSVAFSPDGRKIISASNDKTVRLWDINGRPIGQPFRGHEGFVNSVAFSLDGEKIVSSSDDKTIRLWDIQGNPIGQPFRGHQDVVKSVAFSPDGQRIVSGSKDKTVRLWDSQDVSIAPPFIGHEDTVNSVAFSPDGQMIVSASFDNTVRLWSVQGNPIGQPFRGHEDYGRSVAFSPDGQMIASGSQDKTVRLWDLQGNSIRQPFRGHEATVNSVAFSPDGQRIVSGSADKTVRLWDIQGNPIGQPFPGHDKPVFLVAFSPDGQMIVSGSADKTVRLWNIQGNSIGQPFGGHEGSVNSVAFSPNGQMIVSGSADKTVRLWDIQGNPIGRSLRVYKEIFVGGINSVAFSPDGQMIVSGSSDKLVRLWPSNWQTWLQVCCNRLRYHPVFKNPQTEVEKQACDTCRKYVWDK